VPSLDEVVRELLRELKAERRLTDKALYEMLGMRKNQFIKWKQRSEKDKRYLNVHNLDALAVNSKLGLYEVLGRLRRIAEAHAEEPEFKSDLDEKLIAAQPSVVRRSEAQRTDATESEPAPRGKRPPASSGDHPKNQR
jgi:hypothetical protein